MKSQHGNRSRNQGTIMLLKPSLRRRRFAQQGSVLPGEIHHRQRPAWLKNRDTPTGRKAALFALGQDNRANLMEIDP